MKRGMTLLDLMVVLAMAGLLAAVTVPRWAESKERAMVSEAKAKLRMVSTALEAYRADYSQFPYDGYNYPAGGAQGWGPGAFNYWYLPFMISTPVAYLDTHLVRDPFRRVYPPFFINQFADIRYRNVDSTWGLVYDGLQGTGAVTSIFYDDLQADYGRFHLLSVGPDGFFGPYGFASPSSRPPFAYPTGAIPQPYDPTNGVFSNGDIIRSQICESGYPNMHP